MKNKSLQLSFNTGVAEGWRFEHLFKQYARYSEVGA